MDESCTVYKMADVMGKRWTLPLILVLHKGGGGRKRYSTIKRNLADITPKMLSARLKELEREGLVLRRVDSSVVPVRCEYELSASGKDFVPVIIGIKQWALRWKLENKLCAATDCKVCEL